MYNNWKSAPVMGLNFGQPWCSTLKRGLHSEMGGFLNISTAPIRGGKCFTNPNFINGNNPSLLRHQQIYQTVTKNSEQLVTDNNKKSPVETPPQKPPKEMKKKRKRKRKNRKKNNRKQNDDIQVKTDESPIPELTKSFNNITVDRSPSELARSRMRVPSICESEDSFIVFEDRGVDDGESAIESDCEIVVDESTEVSENEGMSSDSCIPHKKVSKRFYASFVSFFLYC